MKNPWKENKRDTGRRKVACLTNGRMKRGEEMQLGNLKQAQPRRLRRGDSQPGQLVFFRKSTTKKKKDCFNLMLEEKKKK